MGRSRKKSHTFSRLKVLIFALLFLFAALASLLVWTLKTQIEPNLEEIGAIRAKVMVQQIVNGAVNKQLYETGSMEDLLIRKSNHDGQLEVLQANTQAMNLLMTEISKELQAQYSGNTETEWFVPLGVLLGDRILSQGGMEIRLRIRPLSVSSMDFKTEFETQGINQTKYKVYLDLTSEVKVLAPFAEDTFQVATTVLIAEAIILGSVPGSYVSVPEEDILDVTQE